MLVIKRTEEIHLFGAGSQDQHQVEIKAEGKGFSNLLVNIKTGTLQTAEDNQHLDVTVQASGKTYHFKQEAIQRIELIR